jgi:hypothetical protein
MAVNSRRKGKTGELEAAEVLRTLFGWQTRRSQQYCGDNPDSADLRVEQTPQLFWEVKRVNRLNVPKTMRVAASQCGRRTPVLMHRPDRCDWLLTIRLSDLPVLCHAYESAQAESMAPTPLPSAPPSDSPYP